VSLFFAWGGESRDAERSLLPPGACVVEIDLERKDRGTLPRLRHGRLPADIAGHHRGRWSMCLASLQAKATDMSSRATVAP
jgi:hypothetical protein